VLLSGCGKQSVLSFKSPQAHQITLLWWWMLAAATIVFLGAVVMLTIAWFRRGRRGLPFLGERETLSEGLVVLFGIGIPVVALVALFGVANLYVIKNSEAPNPRSTPLTIEVTGHQWWWQVSYPGSGAVTANEIHIPVRTRVDVIALTADVIHSFWVPQLARKIDMIPGRRNRILLYASRPGIYRGQCAEFCGLQHANMALEVVAEPASSFRAWLSSMAAPSTAAASTGKSLFMNLQCASCHQIRGTAARATVGPDLTHVMSRHSLAGDTILNTPGDLAAWIHNPQAIKPGALMPDLGLSNTQVSALVSYLETLH
jgi:cytochrome c oxidase subunit II